MIKDQFTQHVSAETQQTIDAHCDRQRWVIDSKAHGLLMLLTDLLVYADENGLDFDNELEGARDTFTECYPAQRG